MLDVKKKFLEFMVDLPSISVMNKRFVELSATKSDLLLVKKLYYAEEYNQLFKKPNKKAYTLFSHYNETIPYRQIEADILYMPEDNAYSYIITFVDLASRYTWAFPLKTRSADSTVIALKKVILSAEKAQMKISSIIVDGGSEFKGKFKSLMDKTGISLVIKKPSFHAQLVEFANLQIQKYLFKFMSKKELETKQVVKEWVKRLPDSLIYINARFNPAIKMSPVDAIKEKFVKQKENMISVSDMEKKHKIGTRVRRLLNKDEFLNVGTEKIKVEARRATDPYYSLEIYTVDHHIIPQKYNDKGELKQSDLVHHKIVDEKNKLFPHSFNYYQLQEINM